MKATPLPLSLSIILSREFLSRDNEKILTREKKTTDMSFCAFFKIKLGELWDACPVICLCAAVFSVGGLFIGLFIGSVFVLPIVLHELGYISEDVGFAVSVGIFFAWIGLVFLCAGCFHLFLEYKRFKEGPGDAEIDPRPTDETAPEIFLDDVPSNPFETPELDTYNN